MKKKYLFSALAAPVLLAACANEEFMEPQAGSVNSDVLANRAKGELILDASRADALADAATRIVGEETATGGISWIWEGEDDKIGACVVDYTGDVFPTASANYVITNYPFAPKIEGPSKSANFSTPTAVVTGAYMFYNKYDGNNTNRRKLQSSLAGTIQAKAGVQEGLKQVGTTDQGGQNFFISPIIDLAVKDGEAIQKPVQLTSIYSVLKVSLKTELEEEYYKEGFRVNKIVLKSADATNIFKRDITISPQKLQTVQKEVRNALPAEKKFWFKENGAINAMHMSNADVTAALELVNTAIQDPSKAIGELATDDNELVYQLDKEFVFNTENKDEQLDIMVVLPSATYTSKSGATYETKNKGIFLMTVYTSEGIYNSYIMNTADNYTFKRGKMYQVPVKTMKIGAGTTNVELFEQSEAFHVETTQDWNYAVNYINEHYRDYGSANNWTAPVLNLVGDVVVEKDFYFPNFPVKYSGNKQIKLKGQSEYKIDPTKVILDKTADKQPTIVIEGQTGAKIVFDQDIKAGVKASNGDAGTETIKLKSDAQIVINDGKTVDFSTLDSKTDMKVGKNAVVAVAGEFKTAGKVNVAEKATVTSTVAMANNAEMTIEKEAVVTVPNASTNSKNINVTGTLTAAGEFTSTGTIQVNGYSKDMNDASHGQATFNTLKNKGILSIMKSEEKKGTYGGKVNVTTLYNGVDKNVPAVINVNGELKANTTYNEEKATINLMEDPYALIQLASGENKGTIVLTTPAQYEMFDNYYLQNNNINAMKNGAGFIQATMDNATFKAVIDNNKTYNSQENAIQVLEKIILSGDVEVMDVEGAEEYTKNIDFVLSNGSALTIAEDGLAIQNLTTDGASSTIKSKGNNDWKLNVKGTAKVAKNNTLTVNNKATVILNDCGTGFAVGQYQALVIDGTLNNNGLIDCVSGSGLTTYIYTLINSTGKFNNNARLCKDSTPVYTATTENFNLIKDFVAAFKGTSADFTVNGINYTVYKNTSFWTKATLGLTTEQVTEFFKNATVTSVGSYKVFQHTIGGKLYALYTAAEVYTDAQKVATEAKSTTVEYGTKTKYDQIVTNDIAVQGNQFNIKNNGTLYLKATDIAKGIWAYGVSTNSDTATKTGKFTNEI